jgi:hypothetical protein
VRCVETKLFEQGAEHGKEVEEKIEEEDGVGTGTIVVEVKQRDDSISMRRAPPKKPLKQ